MECHYLVAVISTLLWAVNSQPILVTDNSNPNIVPGVFISTDTLRELQEKAQQNQNNANLPITNEPIPPVTSRVVIPPSNNEQQLKIGSAFPTNTLTQNAPPVSSQIPIISQTPISNQPIPNNPQILNPSVPQNPQVLPQQNQPNQIYMLTQQPNQPSFQQPQYQQPQLVNQPGSQPQLYLRQPGNQLYVNQPSNPNQPNQQLVLQNGQYPQPYTNQPLYTNLGQIPPNFGSNVVSNPGTTLYAMVPVNTPNDFRNVGPSNANLGNGNVYYIPPQQQTPLTNQIYSMNS